VKVSFRVFGTATNPEMSSRQKKGERCKKLGGVLAKQLGGDRVIYRSKKLREYLKRKKRKPGETGQRKKGGRGAENANRGAWRGLPKSCP